MTPRLRRAAAWAAVAFAAAAAHAPAALAQDAAAGAQNAPAQAVVERPGEAEEARRLDLAVYEQERETLARDAAGSWVVIARGRLAAAGASLHDVLAVEADAPHRFVFRVGDDHDEDLDGPDWPSPRFAGAPFAAALDFEWALSRRGLAVMKAGTFVTSPDASPVPRARVRLRAPDGTALPAPRGGSEVLLDTVGPALVVTPEDAHALGLERFEVPGRTTIAGIPCRRGLVAASMSGLPGESSLVASWPAAPRDALVERARRRGRLWTWTREDSARALAGVGKDAWIVFGCDRVLGRGVTAEAALEDADAATDVAYHRYLLRLDGGVARPGARTVDVRSLSARRVVLAGRPVEARVGGSDPVVALVSEDVAASLPLATAESPDEVRLVDGGAAEGDASSTPGTAGGPGGLALAAGRVWMEEARCEGPRSTPRARRAALVLVAPREPGSAR